MRAIRARLVFGLVARGLELTPFSRVGSFAVFFREALAKSLAGTLYVHVAGRGIDKRVTFALCFPLFQTFPQRDSG